MEQRSGRRKHSDKKKKKKYFPSLFVVMRSANNKMALPVADINYFFYVQSRVTGAEDLTLRQALEEYRMAATRVPVDAAAIQGTREVLEARFGELFGEEMRDELRDRYSMILSESSKPKPKATFMDKSCYVMTNMQCVAPYLFIGSFHPANDKDLLASNGITHICCCINVDARFPGQFAFMKIAADDSNGYNISQHFDETFKFIDSAVTKGNGVLVHCGAGISRAPTILAAYLMRKLKITADRAIAMIQSVRPCASPNLGFKDQLKQYESKWH